MRRSALVALLVFPFFIPRASAQDTGTVASREPRLIATIPFAPLVPPANPALAPGGRLGPRTTPALAARAWTERVRASLTGIRLAPPPEVLLAGVPAAPAETTAAPVTPPPGAPLPGAPAGGANPSLFGPYANLGMQLSLRFELKADQFKNLHCTPVERQQAISGCNTGFPTISPNPQYAVRTAGVVGQRLHVNVDFDSQREFDANNNLQVWYEGLEDEPLKRIEAGNVTFQIPPSRFISAAIPANNFGVQAIGQVGPLELRGIYAQQKGSVVKDRVYDVGQTTTQPLDRTSRDLDYETGRFFFAADPAAMPGYPAIDILNVDPTTLPDTLRVGSLHVYRVRAISPTSTSNQNIGGVRAVACGAGGGVAAPCPERVGPFQWEILQEGKDYYVDPSGTWFALATRLDQSDYLAVSYIPVGQIACGPASHCVGTFPTEANPDTSAAPDTLRLVYDPNLGVTAASPSFRFQIRNAYRVGGSEVDRSSVQVTLTVNQRERTVATGETYLSRLGLALESDQTKFDQYNRLFPRSRDPQNGAPLHDFYVIFPHLTPFADSTKLVREERNDSLYRTPRSLLFTQGPPSVFAVRVQANVSASADRSTLSLNSFQIREGSEKLYLGSELLQRGTDYSIDYATGQVQFTNPDSLFQGGVSSIHAQFEERAAFAVAPTSIYGLAGKYDLGAVGSVNLLGLFQKEHTAFTRPPLGFEPSASFIGGVSTDLHFQPAWITAAVRSLPGVHSSAPSFLNVSAEVAQSRPSPNQLGQAYIEEFEAEAGRFVSLSENSWQWGSMPCGAPPSCATGAKGLTDFGVSSAGFDPANAATLTWQSLPYNYDPRCGCYDQAIQFTSQQIDPTIVLSGQTQNAEPVLWLALKPDSVLGLAHSGPPLAGSGLPDSTGFPNWVDPARTGPRWRSITQVLSPTGVDLSRVEYLEFWVWEDNHRTAEQNRTAVVFDFGSVFEDAVAWQPLYFTHDAQGDTTYFGRRLVGQGRLDSERDPITKSWNAAINDEGILSDRVIAADGGIDDSTLAVHVDSMPLCSASVNGQIQPYAFGDLRSRCGRHNGFVDTEDQDGDFVLDVNAGVKTEENFTRFVFPIGDDRFFVRDGGMIGVKDSTGRPDGAAGWRLYRIPFRCDTCAVGNPDLRQVQSLRMTIVTPSGSPQVFFGLARIRLVGSTWLKRADTPIRGLGGSTGSGALGSQVIASVVSTENRDLGYTPPPGVTDQASRQDAGFQLGATQINERSMRLLATGLTKGERAEAFERFTDEGDKNFLKYRKLRVWARGRGPGWEDGDLEFYIKAGKDENNFYLYHTPVRTASWDPEVVASFQPWLVLRARIEQAWLAGDSAHVYPGCPDSTLVPYDTAYVMCDGPYIVHVRDPATAPPNLAAVQEMAAGIWRVNDRVFVDQAELWVDDIRLSDVVQDPGTAAALDVSLAASDLATVSFSLSRRDANFRQLGEDPSYVTNDAATLGATFRLDKFLPDRWGISAPFTMQLATTSDAPFYVSGTDIRADVLPGLRTPRSTAASYSLSLRHVRRSLSPWLRDFVDPVSFSASYATGDGRTSLEDLTSSSYVVNVDYNISPGASTVRAAPGFLVRLVQHLPPFLRDGLFFHSLTLARVRWNPSAIRFHSSLSSANASRFSFTVPVAEAADSTLAPTLSRSKIWRNTGSLELLPFNGLQLRVDLASQRDLRDYGDTTTVGRVIRGERRVFLGQDVGFETQRSVNTFLGATPQINSWLRPHVNLSSFFNLNRDPNGQVARAIGDTAGAFRLPDAFSNSRAIDLGTQVDARHLGTSLFGDSSKAAKLLARISSVDLGYTKSISSSFTNVAATPTLGYQLAFGGLDGVRRVNGVFAGAAARNTTARASVAALLPAGFRINTNYQRSSGITYVLRTDAQVPIRTQSRDWPSATLSWTYTPGAATLGKVLATLTASFNVRQHQSVAEQAGFTAGPLGTVRTSVTDRSASPSVSITWLKGIFTSFDATSGKTEQVSAGNVFRSQNAQRNAALSFSFRPPASVAKLPADIRTNLRYTVTSNTTCLQSAGQATCVPYVDSRQTQYQLTMDTSFPSNLSAGLQGAYLLNEERQTSRKVAQLVITAFVQLNTSVGQIQ